ncbi:MAG: DUF2933 domain-containing protein [Gammaproteobacteria bacterium]|nr:DUF2933 domain-containing protein [Gammaproteobacteria bacterium]
MTNQEQSFWFTSKGIAALVFIGAVSYFLLVEHRQHLFAFLPYLILLLCPLMHFFMHGGHGGHHSHGQGQDLSEQEVAQRGLDDSRKGTEHRHHH